MLAYNLMSMFRQTVMRTHVQHTLSTLHGMVAGRWRRMEKQFRQEPLAIICPEKEAGLVLRPVGQCLRSAMLRNLNKILF